MRRGENQVDVARIEAEGAAGADAQRPVHQRLGRQPVPVFRHALPVGHAEHGELVADHRVERRAELDGLVDLGQHHALGRGRAVRQQHILDRLALRGRVDDQQLLDRAVRQHVQQFARAAVALRHAGRVDQHHLLARQQFEQVFERRAIVRGVHRHAEDAAVGAQLFVRRDAVGIERDQAKVGRTVLAGEGRRDLGGGGGLAHARRADQRQHAALVFQCRRGVAAMQIALEHAGGPAVLVVGVGTQALGQLADQRRREAAFQQLLRQARLPGLALQFFHEGERPEAFFDQALHRLQLVHHVELVASCRTAIGRQRHMDLAAQRRPHRPRRGRHRRSSRHFVAQHRWLTRRRGRGAGGGLAGTGQLRHARAQRAGRGRAPGRGRLQRCLGFGLGLAPLEHAVARVVLERQRAGRQALDVLRHRGAGVRLRGGLLGLDRELTLAQHAVAHKVLERQRAHRQLLDVLLHGGLARRRCGAVAEGRLGAFLGANRRALGQRGARLHLGRRLAERGRGAGLDRCGSWLAHGRRQHRPASRRFFCRAFDLLHAFGGHRQHLDALGAGLGRQHHGVVAQGFAQQPQCIARGARREATDLHARSPEKRTVSAIRAARAPGESDVRRWFMRRLR